MHNKLLLFDGHSLIFRMYYAFLRHPMINSKGMDVSILFGFTKYVLELIEKEHPTHVAVCFDPPGGSFRKELYPAYKATRKATPELVIEALEPLKELCGALGMPVLMVPGFEGDDVLASMAKRSAAEGFTVYMVTPDKDFGQMIGDRIFQFKPGKGGENEIVGPAELCASLGICSPSQVIDMLAVCGDVADNVPGVAGVGEVTASKLISRYGSIEGIYAHLDELTPRVAGLFEAAKDHIDLSRTLVTIKSDIPLDVTADDMILNTTHSLRCFELFDYYEFHSLKKYLHLPEGVEEPVPETVSLEWTVVGKERIRELAISQGRCCILQDKVADDIFSTCRNLSVAVCDASGNYASDGPAADYRDILENPDIVKVGYDLKLCCHLLRNEGITLRGTLEDVELLHYLVNPEKSHSLEVLTRSYLGAALFPEEAPAPAAPESLFDMPDYDAPVKPADRFREAVACFLLRDEIIAELRDMKMEGLYYDVEEPLVRVLADMEHSGVKVDMASLQGYRMELSRQLDEVRRNIRSIASDDELNVNSPRQVGTILFEKFRIDPSVKPRKSGNPYPTDEETLLNYAADFPVVSEILEYRAISKLLNTYIEPFGSWVSPSDGRIHTTFNQSLTSTGRLSSSRPNLQNIPIRTPRGQNIRKAFVAEDDGSVILSADYSQIELRLMAHLCGDEHMTQAFLSGQDIHAATASRIFALPIDEVTPQMRRKAKTANFGILYGISSFGLAQRLNIPRQEAKKLIDDYFEQFPAIRNWIDRTCAEAAANGYVQTLFGRRRYLPEINSRNATVRANAQRNAINAPVQGTAADIIKVAMARVKARMEREGLRSCMVLQIHDELLFEVPENEIQTLLTLVKEEMEHVISLNIPLIVECSYGKNWLEAH